MRRYLFFMLMVWAATAEGQNVAVQNIRQNVLFIGVDNPLIIVLPGYACKDLIVATDKGQLSGRGGHYILRVDSVYSFITLTISVKTRGGVRKVTESRLRSYWLKADEATVCGKNGGIITAEEVIKANMPRAYSNYTDSLYELPVVQFTITITHKNEVFKRAIDNTNKNGFKGDVEVVARLQALRSGDDLTISNIKYKVPGCQELNTLSDLNFVIE